MSNLLIVESPNKCGTIRKFLPGWDVEASVGHITTLASDGNDNLGFDISKEGVNYRYVANGDRGASVIKKLKAKARNADVIYLATDPDREGEAISWHLLQQIVGKKPYKRITYTEITEKAIKAAIANAKEIDFDLVAAQQTRQALDKLTGFKTSPHVSRAVGGKSAGRVQSAALHILCERERAIQKHKPEPYWTLSTQYQEGFQSSFIRFASDPSSPAEAAHHAPAEQDEAADPTEDETAETGKRITTETEANRILAIAQQAPHVVLECTGKDADKSAPPPLTTSVLQQAAGVRYRFSSDQTMKLAQELFEGVKLPDGSTHGAITYHRTDSVTLSEEFCESVRDWLGTNHPELVPAKAKAYKNKEGAQGAHEAIRPVEVAFTPERMKDCLTEAQHKLYTLIWQRAVASLCAPAKLKKTHVIIQAGETRWESRGSVVKSQGYAKILGGLGSDSELPALKVGQTLGVQKIWHDARKTAPPSRYSEPRLVQMLERLGIGRPSTYANIIKILKDREYVQIKGKTMVPSKLGMGVDEFLSKFIPTLVDSRFTAKMEGDLDLIAEGKKDGQRYLADFWFCFLAPALRKTGVDTSTKQNLPKSNVKCPECQNSLLQLPLKKPSGSKKHFLKCETCTDIVLFWNEKANDWKRKGEATESRAVSIPGEQTQWICQVCGKPLEKYSYTKEGQNKSMLRCSDTTARQKIDHKDEVYFSSSRGGFWNFARKVEPTSKPSSEPKRVASKR